ncbi:MAG: hypothetical protein WCP89_00280 [archaeon]
MEKGEMITYAITLVSILAVIYFFMGIVSKVPTSSDKNIGNLAGNVVLNPDENLKVGDKIDGEIVIPEKESEVYGVLSLSRDGNQLITKTFNLQEIKKTKNGSDYSIKIEDLIDYSFEEKGNYELFFSVLDLEINIKREFVVN